MPHIDLPSDSYGIVGALNAYPQTGQPLRALAEALLRGPSSLSMAERELIATRVSAGNECQFCTQSHASIARHLLGDQRSVVDDLLAGDAQVDDRLAALLAIADKVRRDGRLVATDDIERARAAGADDQAIHDTVLIAAAFCMFNRYVDGLATRTPTDLSQYHAWGERTAREGYLKEVDRITPSA